MSACSPNSVLKLQGPRQKGLESVTAGGARPVAGRPVAVVPLGPRVPGHRRRRNVRYPGARAFGKIALPLADVGAHFLN